MGGAYQLLARIFCTVVKLKDTKPVPSPANFNEVESIFMRHMGEIMSGAATPEAGMKAAHEELAAAMAKLKAG